MVSTTRKSPKLKGLRSKLGLDQKCPPGQILRAPYTRKFKSAVKKEGFLVKHGNKTVRVYPKSGTVLVKATCVVDTGLPGKGPKNGKGIGPLKQGELTKYGYNAHKSTADRYVALRKAIAAYGALRVFRKLNAVANLTLRTAPEAHAVFDADRKWVQKNYTLKK